MIIKKFFIVFIKFLNSLRKDLKFKVEIAKVSSCFLNLKISIVGYKLVTTISSKPTGRHLKAIDEIQKVFL